MLFTLEQKLYKTKNGQMYSEIIVKDDKGDEVDIYGYKVSTNLNFKTLIYENEIICKLGGEKTIVNVDVSVLGLKQIINAKLVDDFNRALAMDSDSHNTDDPVPVKDYASQ